MQKSSFSYLSESFREMPSYTKHMYFIIYWRPRVWVFSALLYCCCLGDQASTPLLSYTARTALTQLVPTNTTSVLSVDSTLIFSISLTGQRDLLPTTYSLAAKDRDTSGICHQEKAEPHFQRQREGHLWGSSETSPKVLHLHLKYKLQSPICTASLRSAEALSLQKQRRSLTMQNTRS